MFGLRLSARVMVFACSVIGNMRCNEPALEMMSGGMFVGRGLRAVEGVTDHCLPKEGCSERMFSSIVCAAGSRRYQNSQSTSEERGRANRTVLSWSGHSVKESSVTGQFWYSMAMRNRSHAHKTGSGDTAHTRLSAPRSRCAMFITRGQLTDQLCYGTLGVPEFPKMTKFPVPPCRRHGIPRFGPATDPIAQRIAERFADPAIHHYPI
jgi:hypothetical protein